MLKKLTFVLLATITLCISPINLTSNHINVAEASININNNCWNGDPNYPLVHEAIHSMCFADKSSSCFAKHGAAILVTTVLISTGEPFRQNVYYFSGGPEDLSYKVDDGAWKRVESTGISRNVYRVVRNVLKFN